MTRETKIGLLVGLAFIIVIGILLSDYNRNENPTASLTPVAAEVQKSTATPHNGSTETQVVLPPALPAPTRPVPTRAELHQETTIAIGPGTGNALRDRSPVRPAPNDTVVKPPVDNGPPIAINNNNNNASSTGLPPGLRNIVDQNTGDLTAVNPPSTPEAPPRAPQPPSTPTVNGARQYVAIAGDTVSKLAGRFLGANTKANREAIIAMNATLKQNPNNVIVGHTYMIPPKPGTPGAAPIIPARPIAAAPAPAAPESPKYIYVVKENDNLWKIAAEQLGDGTAWAAIKDLNKDILKGGEALRPNMKLRLPAKPVASVN